MNPNYPHPILAREGWPFIAITFVVAALWTSLAGFGFIAAVLWILFILVTQFFRDPAREVPAMPDAVLCPVDGRVIKVEETVNPYTQEKALMISVFMNIFNVHCQRSPVAGVIEDVQYYPGKFLNADLDKASTENETQCHDCSFGRWHAYYGCSSGRFSGSTCSLLCAKGR